MLGILVGVGFLAKRPCRPLFEVSVLSPGFESTHIGLWAGRPRYPGGPSTISVLYSYSVLANTVVSAYSSYRPSLAQGREHH